MQSAVCVGSETPLVNPLLVCIGCIPSADQTPPLVETKKKKKKKHKKKRRSESLSDITNYEPKKKKRLKTEKVLAELTERPASSALSEAVWIRIRSMIVAVKSLRSITRVTLAFFKEYELAQMRLSGLQKPVYPVVVPVSEAYFMLAPRKRRVYDVLHVLEGIGVLKRVSDKVSTLPRFRGGHFLYYGCEGALSRLKAIHQHAQVITKTLMEMHPTTTQEEIDAMVIRTSNAQAMIEGWPHLALTTVSFLSFVLQNDTCGMHSLGLLNRRLVEARLTSEDGLSSEGRESLLVETTRRVYDVVSVLATLNVVVISSLSDELKKKAGRRQGFATPRKGVLFNKAIFVDKSLLRIGTSPSSQLAMTLSKEKFNVSESKCASAEDNTDDISQGLALDDETSLLPSVCHEDLYSVVDLFPDIEPSECVDNLTDWWDVPLRDLLLRDSLPPVDFLDWEIMQAISRSRLRTVGNAAPFVTSDACDKHLGEEVDLECHEQLHSA